MSKQLVYDFPKVSAEEWMDVVRKDLKSTNYDQLKWIIDDDILLEPIVTDVEKLDLNINKEWENQSTLCINGKTPNKTILEALNNGIGALAFKAFESIEEYQVIFENVNQLYISWQIKLSNTAEYEMIKSYFAKEADITFQFTTIPDSELVKDILNNFNQSKFAFDTNFETNKYSDNIVRIIDSTHQFIQKMNEAGIEPNLLLDKIVFETKLGKEYLIEIGYLRALHLVWKNYSTMFGKTSSAAKIVVGYDKSNLTEDPNYNLIRLTTFTMSAILGSSYKIYCNNFDENINENIEATRLSNNIQMILNMESYFNYVTDPTAGSYFIDAVTQKLTKKSWEKLTNLLG